MLGAQREEEQRDWPVSRAWATFVHDSARFSSPSVQSGSPALSVEADRPGAALPTGTSLAWPESTDAYVRMTS